MKIAVEGCAHGQLENIYNTIQSLEKRDGIKIDLLICCGDFQSTRNEADLRCMAIPPKYYDICSFYKYYTGEKTAPVLTIFIGGNHEASNYLQELPYGGWVAPNIYYLGYSGVINVAGVRIGGLSGIYKGHDFFKGHFEKAPYDENSKRSVYHVRNLEVFRLKQLSQPIDIFLSHEWPTRITNYGNKKQLLSFKKFLRDDIESEKLGNQPCEELLNLLEPTYWFAAHLHCKFAAVVPHDSGKNTKFLALDKCLPNRRFLQVVDVPHDPSSKIEISYDLEWLTILFLTNHLLNTKKTARYMPGPNGDERWSFTPTEDEKSFVLKKFHNDLSVPNNFVQTAPGYDMMVKKTNFTQPQASLNPQTVSFCEKLSINDPLALILSSSNNSSYNIHDISNDENNSYTFVSDTDVSASTNQTSRSNISQSRISLNLPEPKNDQQNSNVSLVSDILDLSNSVETSNINVCSLNDNEEVNNPEVSKSSTPAIKKFKRRNADIYENNTT